MSSNKQKTITNRNGLTRNGESADSWPNLPKQTHVSSKKWMPEANSQALLAKYPTPSRLAADYNPDLQGKLAKSSLTLADLALHRNIPSLDTVCATYGEDTAIRWLKVQFDNLNDYAEQGKGMTDSQLDELCHLVLGAYHRLNLAEICNFIARFKLGIYGPFYGAVGPMKITCSLKEYMKERQKDLERKEREVCRLNNSKEIAERARNWVSRSRYLEIKQRAEEGDEEAQKQLMPPRM